MPLYEYECDACGGRFEVIQKFSETTEHCRRCGKGPVRRLMSSPAIQFKGTGWYITDYARKGQTNGESKSDSSSKSSSAPATESKSESKKTESASSSDKSTSTSSSTSSTSA